MKKLLSKLFLCLLFVFAVFGNILASEVVHKKTNEKLNSSESFSIKDISQKLSEAISTNSKGNIFSVKYGYLIREGSEKSYSLDEAEKSGIKDMLEVSQVTIDDKTKFFEAILTPEKATYRLIATGKYTESRRIPVAKTLIRKGALIEESDIAFKHTPDNKVVSSALDNEKYIIGKQAKRNIARSSQILSGDVENPIVIKKGKAVIAIYREKNMELKVTAQAMSDGRVGEIIKLKNIDSGKEFMAMAERQNTALVNFQEEVLANR